MAYDATSDINAYKQAQIAAATAALNKAKTNSLAALDTEKATIAPEYYKQRNTVSTQSQMNGKNFAEYMAARGQSNAGVAGQSELSRGVALQGALGTLNNSEANSYADIAKRQAQVQSDYEANLAAAKNGIDASAMQQIIAANQRNYELSQQQANADRNYNYQVSRDEVGDKRYSQQYDNQLTQQQLDNAYRQSRANEEDNRWLNQYRNSQTQYADQQTQQALENEFKRQQLALQYQAAQQRSSGGSSVKSTTASTNKDLSSINDIVNGSYNLSEKARVLNSYLSSLEGQSGPQIEYLKQYAQQALQAVSQQLSDYNSSGRYAGM